jgi:P4 family phage/plasmid primase-like protien
MDMELKFNTINEVFTFTNLSVTDQANQIADDILKHFVKVYGKESNLKYMLYDSKKKLWNEHAALSFKTFFYKFLNNSAKNITKIVEEAEQQMPGVSIKNKKLTDLIKSFDSQKFINDLLLRVSGLLLDEEFPLKMNNLKDFLPIKNGKKINFKNLEITDREMTDNFTFECPVKYVNKTPNADKFFKQLFPEEDKREFFRKVLGYMLSGDTAARCFFVFYGLGSNAKSVINGLLDAILNSYYHQCSEDVFLKKKSTAGGCSPHMVSLLGKRMATFSEGETADKMDMNLQVLKQVSGEDKISARGLYTNEINFYTNCKLVLLSNFVPPLTADKSIKDRIRYVYYDQRFVDEPKEGEHKKDTVFVDKLKNEYLDEVFTWIVKGSQEYYKDKRIDMPPEWNKRMNESLVSNDSIESFITEFIKPSKDPKAKIMITDLFKMYNKYSSKASSGCKVRSNFFERVAEKYTKVRINGYYYFKGIECTYKPPMEPEDLEGCVFDDDEINPLDHGVPKKELTKEEKDKEEAIAKFIKEYDLKIKEEKEKESKRLIQETEDATIDSFHKKILNASNNDAKKREAEENKKPRILSAKEVNKMNKDQDKRQKERMKVDKKKPKKEPVEIKHNVTEEEEDDNEDISIEYDDGMYINII